MKDADWLTDRWSRWPFIAPLSRHNCTNHIVFDILARMFDYFDSGIMEILQHRLAHTAAATSGTGEAMTFTGQQMARRVTSSGIIELLIQWSPANM